MNSILTVWVCTRNLAHSLEDWAKLLIQAAGGYGSFYPGYGAGPGPEGSTETEAHIRVEIFTDDPVALLAQVTPTLQLLQALEKQECIMVAVTSSEAQFLDWTEPVVVTS